MEISVFILFALCIPACVATQNSNDNVGKIGFQVHSWDDLRGWEQGFWKGVQWMKIDVHWMPADFCANQTRVIQDPRGCFVLTHDPPPNTTTVPQYYSTQSVLEYITSTQYSHFFQQPDRTIYIALCFKYTYGEVCNQTSEDAQNWFSLTDELFDSYNAAVEKYDLNLEFVLDGTAATANCTAQKWRPWVKTWSGPTDDPAFTTSSMVDGLDRLIVLDPEIYEHETIELDPAYWVTEYASKNFGKFANTTYPWLWWEPSNQDTITTVCDTYLATGQYHDPGFLFATNTDPVMFQIFSATETNNVAWNHQINTDSSFLTSHPFVSVLPSPSKGLYYVIVTFYLEDLFKNDYYYYVFSTTDVLGPITTVTHIQSLSTDSSITAISNVKTVAYDSSSGSSNITLVADKVGGFEGYQLTPAGNLHKYCSGKFPNTKKVSFSSFDIYEDNDQLYLVEAYSLGQDDLQFQVYLFDPVTCHVTACGNPSGSTLSLGFSSLSIAVAPSGDGTYEGVVTLSGSKDEIYVAYVSFSVDDQCNAQFASQVTSQPIDVGTNSIVSSVVVDETPMIMEVHTNGYCWNSANHNKGSTVLMCDHEPVSVTGLLAYNYGPVSGWLEHIQSNLELSSCSPYLVSGSYDGGYNPFVALFSNMEGTNAGVVAVHQGISSEEEEEDKIEVTLNQREDCGLPLPYSGILMDSWPLPAVNYFM